MEKEPRYELRLGKFGQYFHDLGEDKDLALADVLNLLNEDVVSRSEHDKLFRKYEEERSNSGAVATEKSWLKTAYTDMKDQILKRGIDLEKLLVERLEEIKSLKRQLDEAKAEIKQLTYFDYCPSCDSPYVPGRKCLCHELKKAQESADALRSDIQVHVQNYRRCEDDWRTSVEEALGLESDPAIHTRQWAHETILAVRENGQPHEDPRRTEYVVKIEKEKHDLESAVDIKFTGPEIQYLQEWFEKSFNQLLGLVLPDGHAALIQSIGDKLKGAVGGSNG